MGQCTSNKIEGIEDLVTQTSTLPRQNKGNDEGLVRGERKSQESITPGSGLSEGEVLYLTVLDPPEGHRIEGTEGVNRVGRRGCQYRGLGR